MATRETRSAATTTAVIVAMALSLLGLSTAQAAHADTNAQPVTMRFAYDRSAPPAATYPQLKKAAREACRHAAAPMQSGRTVAACARMLIDDGVAKIGSPDLATLHALSTRRPLPAYAANGRTG